MNRTSSFFWQSDDLNDESEGDDVGLILHEEADDDEEPSLLHTRPSSDDAAPPPPPPRETAPLLAKPHWEYYTSPSVLHHKTNTPQSIRFQVVVWYVGPVDVQLGHVAIQFRVTIFWEDDHASTGSSKPPSVWKMQGRHKASLETLDPQSNVITIDVPPVSILNAVDLELVGGGPEVSWLKRGTTLRWTCLYKATLFQDIRVDNFPHDRHDLTIRLGILAHRGPGQRWDKRVYRMGLATEEDSQGSTRIPYGLIVDHVSIPDFSIESRGLSFDFLPLPFGTTGDFDDQLHVKLPVCRESGHYDKSIMPTLLLLNFLAITCLVRNFASATASTETMLSIAFVQVGIRLSIDSRLPSVGYQIKMQRTMNQCFWMLCGLVLESNIVFFLVSKLDWRISTTNWIDLVTALCAFPLAAYTGYSYYRSKE